MREEQLKRGVFVVALVGLVLVAGCVGPLAGESPDSSDPGTGISEDDNGDDEYYGGGSQGGAPSVSLSDVPGPDDTVYSSGGNSTPEGSESLNVHFIDVGQSDSTLIQGPESNILIDTGDWQGDEAISYLESEGIEEIDLMILTHLDADHIGQADRIIDELGVEEVWMSGQSRSTNTFGRLVDAVLENDVGYYEPRTGDVFSVGDMRIEVLHPDGVPSDTNDGIATRIVFGESEVLFTGDAGESAESDMLQTEMDVESDIYQVGHHGSSTSSMEEFVKSVNPDIAVYSAGEDNQYGHPDDVVINRLNDIGADVYGTPVHGTVVIEATPEEDISVSTERDASLVDSPPTLLPGNTLRRIAAP